MSNEGNDSRRESTCCVVMASLSPTSVTQLCDGISIVESLKPICKPGAIMLTCSRPAPHGSALSIAPFSSVKFEAVTTRSSAVDVGKGVGTGDMDGASEIVGADDGSEVVGAVVTADGEQ